MLERVLGVSSERGWRAVQEEVQQPDVVIIYQPTNPDSY
jgi:acetolactate synthase regulatory subunit